MPPGNLVFLMGRVVRWDEIKDDPHGPLAVVLTLQTDRHGEDGRHRVYIGETRALDLQSVFKLHNLTAPEVMVLGWLERHAQQVVVIANEVVVLM